MAIVMVDLFEGKFFEMRCGYMVKVISMCVCVCV